MTFGREWVLWLVPAAFLLPAAVRLLVRPPRPEVRFGAMAVLREALADIRARRRYRPALALLLRCLGAASAAFAFSSPVMRASPLPLGRAAAGAPSDVVFLLDRSYSMRAAYAGSDRFSLAAETAASALRELGPEDRAALILFDRETPDSPAWSRDPEELARRAQASSPGWETTDYRPALEAAFALLSDGERPGARKAAVLLSDGSADGLAGMKDGLGSLKDYDPSFRVAGLDFSGGKANSWALPVRRPGPGRALEAAVAWNRAASASPPSRLSVCGPGGGLLPGPPLRRTGSASASAVFAADPARGCAAAGPDALPADDRAYYAFPDGPASPGVLVLHPGPEDPEPGGAAYFIKELFSSGAVPYSAEFRHYGAAYPAPAQGAGPLVLAGLPAFSPETASALDRWLDAGGTVIAFVASSRPQSAELKGYFGLVSAGPEEGPFSAHGWGEGVLPGFSPSAYDISRVSASALYRPAPGGYETLLEFRGPDGRKAPALVGVRRGAGRVYIWTASLDLAWCDLAVKPAFPSFFSSLLGLSAAGGSGPSGWGSVVGRPGDVKPRTPAADYGAELIKPSGATETLRSRRGIIGIPAQAEPGLYRWRAGGEKGYYAVNLDHSTRESALEPESSPPWTRIPAASALDSLGSFVGGVQAWPLFLLLAALLLSAEAALQRRRRS